MRKKSKSNKYSHLSDIEKAFVKNYSYDELQMLKTYNVDKLKQIIAEQNAHVLKAKKEMESNAEFKAAQEVLQTFRSAFNETKNFADSKRVFALSLLQKEGVVDMGAELE
jgi:hypothetical protein